MGFLRKYLDTKQVQEHEIENLEQGGVPSVPSVPSELEFPARLDKNWSEEIEENEGEVFQEVFQAESDPQHGDPGTSTGPGQKSGIGREVPPVQKPQGFATPPNNSTESTNSTKLMEKHTLEEYPSDLTEEEEALIESFLAWVRTCLPGEEWTIPQDWLADLGDSDELRVTAEEKVRKRNPTLRIWRTGEDKLVCKVWIGDELPPYRKPPKKSRFGKSSTRRNERI
jgi:hypothetical protein